MSKGKKKAVPPPRFDVVAQDCVEYLGGLRRKPNLIVADPPYNYGQDYDYGGDNLRHTEYLDWTRSWLAAAHAALDRHGSMWVFAPDEWVSEIDLYCRKHLGMTRRSWVVWYYTFGVSSPTNFARSHTHILYFTKTKTKFTAHPESVKVPSARQLVYNDRRQKAGGKMPDNTWVLVREQLTDLFAADMDTWLESRICGTFKERKPHSPNQLPEPVVERIVRFSSDPGDLVVDPFVGTGTTGVVAVRNGRDFAGCDLSKTCVAASAERIGRAVPVPA